MPYNYIKDPNQEHVPRSRKTSNMELDGKLIFSHERVTMRQLQRELEEAEKIAAAREKQRKMEQVRTQREAKKKEKEMSTVRRKGRAAAASPLVPVPKPARKTKATLPNIRKLAALINVAENAQEETAQTALPAPE